MVIIRKNLQRSPPWHTNLRRKRARARRALHNPAGHSGSRLAEAQRLHTAHHDSHPPRATTSSSADMPRTHNVQCKACSAWCVVSTATGSQSKCNDCHRLLPKACARSQSAPRQSHHQSERRGRSQTSHQTSSSSRPTRNSKPPDRRSRPSQQPARSSHSSSRSQQQQQRRRKSAARPLTSPVAQEESEEADVIHAPAIHTAPLVSIASDGTHLISNQINRIALHKAKAIEIKRAKRQAAHTALPRVDISATPDELAPVSMHMHGGATSHFRRRFRFGGVSAAVAVAHTNAEP